MLNGTTNDAPSSSNSSGFEPDGALLQQARTIEDGLRGLKRIRDELRLQIHLAKAEARNRFQALEDRWDELVKKIPTRSDIEREFENKQILLQNVSTAVVDDLDLAYRMLREDVRREVEKHGDSIRG